MITRPRFGLVVAYVKDIEKAKRFYVESFGLRIEREAPSFVQFEHFAIASDERVGEGDGPELFWLVDDADAAYHELAAKVPVCLALETKPFGKVFGVRDPDGGARFVLELSASRPSRAIG
jgi:catechol 2,3-dioxygenase-like lactoylglutathione lyase family enzyme